MPQLGESVAEGTIGKWLKNIGDHVEKYEPIVEVITDKVNAEVPSPFEGTLTEILVKEGETVPNNTEIAVIDAAGEAAAVGPVEAPAGGALAAEGEGTGALVAATADETHGAGAPSQTGESDNGASATGERTIFGTGHGPAGSDERPAQSQARSAAAAIPAPPQVIAELTPPTVSGGNGTAAGVAEYEGRMTPAVRRLAREHGVDLSLISGTGHSGRITRDDVMRFVESGGQSASAQPQVRAVPSQAAAAEPSQVVAALPAQAAATPTQPAVSTATAISSVADELKAQTPMRRAIAAQMVKAKQTAPHAYTTVETDMSGVMVLRDGVKRRYQAEHGTSLSFVAIVAKAVVEAVRKHPDLNAHWTDEGLARKGAINLGIAVAVDDGLVVPVIRNADQLSIHGLNLALQDLAARARSNKLRLDDIQGGTFTLNNTGWFGSVASQPIVNVPQVAILSMEAIVKRAVVIESPAGDSIAIRPVMNLCTSFDHRATDGAQVGRFVQDVRRWLESVDGSTSIW
jgi:2-oxoisovalerate dehydrogenase E2 component (dihydrolipoyl transacylase)